MFSLRFKSAPLRWVLGIVSCTIKSKQMLGKYQQYVSPIDCKCTLYSNFTVTQSQAWIEMY